MLKEIFLKKASFFLSTFVVQFSFALSSFAEKVTIQPNLSQQEVMAALSMQEEYSQAHEFFESTLEWLYFQVPYIVIQPESDPNLAISGKTLETFQPNFTTMQQKQYSYLIHYKIQQNKESYTITYNLYDALYQELSLSNSYTLPKSKLLQGTKAIATEIYHHLTTEFPFFIGRLFYTERSNKTGRQALFSQEVDGTKKQYTSPSTLLTSPSYCNGGNQVFTSIKEENQPMNIQQIDIQNLTRSSVHLPSFLNEQNLSSPHISPECDSLLFSAISGNKSQIFHYSFLTQRITKIVEDKHINTKAFFGENNTVYYVSSKYGSPKIFARSQSGNTGIVSRGMGAYISFAVSPDFKKIAFTKIFNGTFYTGVMNIDGSSEILFKSGYIIESPSWAPFGKNFIVAIQETSSPERVIYSISSLTGNSYPLKYGSKNTVQVDWLINEADTIKPKTH